MHFYNKLYTYKKYGISIYRTAFSKWSRYIVIYMHMVHDMLFRNNVET